MTSSRRKVAVQRSDDAVHLHVEGPTLAQNKPYQEFLDLMGWGDTPMPNLPMSTVSTPSTMDMQAGPATVAVCPVVRAYLGPFT
jgi:hypothetical protein